MVAENDGPIANPSVVVREESDEWAILFDPDTGKSFGLNPISVFVWKRLDGRHTIRDIVVDLWHDSEEAGKSRRSGTLPHQCDDPGRLRATVR